MNPQINEDLVVPLSSAEHFSSQCLTFLAHIFILIIYSNCTLEKLTTTLCEHLAAKVLGTFLRRWWRPKQSLKKLNIGFTSVK